jgi:hypothetical protein
MTIACHPHPFASRWALLVALAFVAVTATSLLVADWAAAVPRGDRRVLSEPAASFTNHAQGTTT